MWTLILILAFTVIPNFGGTNEFGVKLKVLPVDNCVVGRTNLITVLLSNAGAKRIQFRSSDLRLYLNLSDTNSSNGIPIGMVPLFRTKKLTLEPGENWGVTFPFVSARAAGWIANAVFRTPDRPPFALSDPVQFFVGAGSK
jgi:hypothetical protein